MAIEENGDEIVYQNTENGAPLSSSSRPDQRHYCPQTLVFIGFAGFLRRGNTKMTNELKWFATRKMNNSIFVIFVS